MACILCGLFDSVNHFNYTMMEATNNQGQATGQATGKPNWNNFDFPGYSAFEEYDIRATKEDVLSLLKKHSWSVESEGEKEQTHLVRNGSEKGTLYSDRTFMVQSSTDQFEKNSGYPPSSVFSILECGGDYKQAEIELKKLGFGLKAKSRKKKAKESNDPYLEAELQSGEKIKWYTNDGTTSVTRLKNFWIQEGFQRISVEGRDELTVIRNENKLLIPFNIGSDIVSYLQKRIAPEDKHLEVDLETLLQEKKTTLIDRSWFFLDGVEYKLNLDKKDTVYIPFKNGVAKILKDGFSIIPYSSPELDFFHSVESINHDFAEFDLSESREMGNYEKFFISAIIGRNADEEGFELTPFEQKTVIAFYSMFGYYLSNYKDEAEAKACILTDEGANGEKADGGRGKNLMAKGICKFVGWNTRTGSEITADNHSFGDLELYHDVYIIDELPANFLFAFIYSAITNDITKNQKHIGKQVIVYKHTPKFLLLWNFKFMFHEENTSTNRRFNEYKLSKFWQKQDVRKYFGQEFFSEDWDQAEWQKFFEFAVKCVYVFLNHGLIKIDYSKEGDNYEARFFNEVKEGEMIRIMNKLEEIESFNVADFLNEYKNGKWSFDKFFNHITAKDHIQIYLDFHKKNFKYDQRVKRWIKEFPEGETNKMPF